MRANMKASISEDKNEGRSNEAQETGLFPLIRIEFDTQTESFTSYVRIKSMIKRA